MSARSIHPFPARMAPDIALNAIPESSGADRLVVIDPMCGSGTVLSAAISRGQNAIGVDIDPLAVLMSRVATARIDATDLLTTAEEVRRIAQVAPGVAPWADDETEKFINYWFAPQQKHDLIALTSAIDAVDSEQMRAALRVALSRIIITKTPQASLAADTSHSRPHKVVDSSEYNVFEGFLRSVRSLKRLLEARITAGTAMVKRGDSRVLEGVPSASVDLAVTSPPYLNALDYMRGHKFALVWFGYSIPQLRALRGSSIGAERAPDTNLSAHATELVDFIRHDVSDQELLPTGTLQRFAEDMSGFSLAIRRVLKSEGQMVLVVGNSTLRGNYIRNDVIVRRAMENVGFKLSSRVEREIPASSRYMAINTRTSNSALSNRMRTEVVLTMGGAL